MFKNKSTFWFGLAYLSCIPLFAGLYSCTTDGFYQSNIKVENTYTEHAKEIAAKFCDELAQIPPPGVKEEERQAQQEKIREVSNYRFSRSDMACGRLRIEKDDRLEFTVVVIRLHKKPPACPAAITVPCKDVTVVLFLVTLSPFDVKTLAPELVAFDPPIAALVHPVEYKTLSVPYLYPDDVDTGLVGALKKALFTVYDDVPTILLNEPFDVELATFLKESSGLTSSASDNCLRMLYLSAVTITTIGYGDIVPITPRARSFVTIEAVVGAVLIGMFLSSLGPRGPSGSPGIDHDLHAKSLADRL